MGTHLGQTLFGENHVHTNAKIVLERKLRNRGANCYWPQTYPILALFGTNKHISQLRNILLS